MKKIIFLGLFLSLNVHAFKYSPMIATINVDKNKSILGVLTNEGDLPIAVQLTPKKRDVDVNGKETLVDELDDLAIYPPQVIVPGKGKKTFKITYIGKNLGSSEKSYRVVAEESPVDLNPIKTIASNISFKVRYHSALYVSPKNTKSAVEVTSVSRDGKRLKVLLTNSGNRHQNLNKLKVFILKNAGDKNPIVIDGQKDLRGITTENILANSQRVFYLNRAEIAAKFDSNYIVRIEFAKD